MQQPTISTSRRFIRDDIWAGGFLNRKIKSPYDFKRAECYRFGDKLAISFSHQERLVHGDMATFSIAVEDGFFFTKGIIHKGLALFFENVKFNNIRLQALTPTGNKQALRLVDIAGFTREGILRNYTPNGDVVISSMLKEEYGRKYGIIQLTKNASSAGSGGHN